MVFYPAGLGTKRLMPHLRPRGVCSLRDEGEPNCGVTMGTFGANGHIVHQFILFGLEPHEPKTFGAGADLR